MAVFMNLYKKEKKCISYCLISKNCLFKIFLNKYISHESKKNEVLKFLLSHYNTT